MSDMRIIASIKLKSHHQPTGNTKHYRGGGLLPAPSELRIVQYSDDPGYFLLHLNAEGEELTDTWHAEITHAMEQAEFEFSVLTDDWIVNT